MDGMKLLDAFCGAGGAGMGYHRAGFTVVGVDRARQPNFPFEFHWGDALEFIKEHAHEFDAIHASPPCQRYSKMTNCRPGLADEYDDLVEETIELLDATGKPYIIENVPGSPLEQDVMLCGMMVGLPLYRHRIFESNIPLTQPPHPPHVIPASRAGHWLPGTIMSISGNVSPIREAERAMGIDWMRRAELGEAIPPAYTELLGKELMAYLTKK